VIGIKNNCHSSGRSLPLYPFLERGIKLTVVSTEEYHCYQLHRVLSSILVSRLTPYVDEIVGDHECGF
jgi:hypothetical protein